ncbi:MAG: right-handed parallel beta-helix repeat-containing protein, partial [Thermoplasmata archaeon]|nr:right-handed parallel beta-helix repeat-containing protein [Thermoplasmata archaeon]
GDNVTDYVDFDPWLTRPVGEAWSWYVDDDAPPGGDGSRERPFNRIQDAIDAAEEGATIYVWDGTYYENVMVNKSVSLIGNGSELTVIDGGGSGDVVRITADWVKLSGFCVIGSGDPYAGIMVNSDYNHIFKNNCSNCKYGIKLISSNHNTLSNNSLSMNYRDGIRFQDSNYNTITNSTITGNKRGILVIGPSVGNEFHYNIICGNEKQGIAVGTEKDFIKEGSIDQYLINATHNYWGDDSGPYHPARNPDGKGDIVTDHVDFEPWLNENGTIHRHSSPGQEDDDKFIPTPAQTAAGIVVVSSIGLFGLAYLREDLRFALLSILTIPLYTKLEKDDILGQTNRRDIYSYLVKNPGTNLSTIFKELNIGYGTLVHHLNVLERERHIRSRKEMGRKMFYPKNSGWPPDNALANLPLSSIQSKLLDYLKENGPST